MIPTNNHDLIIRVRTLYPQRTIPSVVIDFHNTLRYDTQAITSFQTIRSIEQTSWNSTPGGVCSVTCTTTEFRRGRRFHNTEII